MKFKALGLVLAGGLMLVGCKLTVVDGGGGSTSTTSTTGSKMTTSSTSTGTTTGTTTTGGGDCGTLGCTDCQNCAQDPGGECNSLATTCDGNAECGAFLDCVDACPADDASTPDVDENFDCLCTNDGSSCTANQMAGTCVGDHPDGVDDASALFGCVLGDDTTNPPTAGVCSQSCAM
jgi:hypothetical protein